MGEHVVWRVVMMVAGYAAGVAAAILFLNLVVPIVTFWPEPVQSLHPEIREGIFVGSFVISLLAVLPALLFLAWAEWRSQRRPSFFAIAGAASAAIPVAVIDRQRSSLYAPFDETAFTLVIAAGAVAGLAYWAVAGRRSGFGASLR